MASHTFRNEIHISSHGFKRPLSFAPCLPLGPITHTSLLINTFQTLSLLPFPCQVCASSEFLHSLFRWRGRPFPQIFAKLVPPWYFFSPLQTGRQRDLHWSLQLGTLPLPMWLYIKWLCFLSFFFFFLILVLSENIYFFLIMVFLPIKCKLCDSKDLFFLLIMPS